MKKIKLIDKAKIILLKSSCKIDRLFHKEIASIFDNLDSIDYPSCKFANYIYTKQYRLYAKNGSYIEGAYQDILYKLCNLIQEIKPNPSLEEILYIFVYIVRNGYLSINNNLTFAYPKHELDTRKGLSIVTGESRCTNLSNMLVDLLYYFNINSTPIMTDRITYKYETAQIIEDFYNLLYADDSNDDVMQTFYQRAEKNNISPQLGNHSEVLILSKPFLIIDPTSMMISKVTTNTNSSYPALNYVRLWSLYAEGLYSLNFVCSMHQILKTKSLKIVKNKKIIQMQQDCFDTCEKNKDKIKQFHKTINKNIIFLNEQLKSLD